MANYFQVDFGFNDTILTKALDYRQFEKAAKLIEENAHTSLLDEGPQQRIPLFIVCSGDSLHGKEQTFRNLHIAKLLLMYGASPNRRIPVTEYGNFISPGQTGLQLIVDLYLKTFQKDWMWNPSRDVVIGLDGQPLSDIKTLQQELLDLAYLFLCHGADANLSTNFHETLLHHAFSQHVSEDLMKLLCENGADINGKDLLDRTPLLIFARNTEAWHHDQANCLRVLQYLLTNYQMDLDLISKDGHSALFALLFHTCQSQAALLLIQAGASPTLYCSFTLKSPSASPLVAALYSPPVKQLLVELCFSPDISLGQDCLSQLVDSGYFTNVPTLNSLRDGTPNDLEHLLSPGPQVINLLFGCQTSSLRQKAARCVFLTWLKARSLPKLEPALRGGRADAYKKSLARQMNRLNLGVVLLSYDALPLGEPPGGAFNPVTMSREASGQDTAIAVDKQVNFFKPQQKEDIEGSQSFVPPGTSGDSTPRQAAAWLSNSINCDHTDGLNTVQSQPSPTAEASGWNKSYKESNELSPNSATPDRQTSQASLNEPEHEAVVHYDYESWIKRLHQWTVRKFSGKGTRAIESLRRRCNLPHDTAQALELELLRFRYIIDGQFDRQQQLIDYFDLDSDSSDTDVDDESDMEYW